MKRKTLFCLLYLFIVQVISYANDSLTADIIGGTVLLETSVISIEREDLRISYIQKDDLWHVSVRFIFNNPSNEAISSKIAFINKVQDNEEYNGEIRNFKTFINNSLSKYSYEKATTYKKSNPDYYYYDERFISSIVFNPGFCSISHEYDFFGSIVFGPELRGFRYTLSTADNWSGPIKVFNLLIDVPDNSVLFITSKNEFEDLRPFGNYKLAKTDNYYTYLYIKNGGLFASIDSFIPDKDLYIELCDWNWFLKNEEIFGFEKWGQPRYNKPRVSFYSLLNERLNEKQLSSYSKDELRLLRNVIYAFHGYNYISKDLQEYFSDKWFYIPSVNFKESDLSIIEKYNVNVIKKYEDSIK